MKDPARARKPNPGSKAHRAEAILDALEGSLPEAAIELDFGTELELLVAVLLSAQCTDKRVNLVTPALFRRYRSPGDYAGAEISELEGFIRTCGLFHAKAKNLKAAGRAMVEHFEGRVPRARAELETLPGIGHKSAGVIAMHLSGEPAFPVDTHVARLARRMGLTAQIHPDHVERDLAALIPSERWSKGHHLLIWHGRRVCFARNPRCQSCVVSELCPRKGVKKRARR